MLSVTFNLVTKNYYIFPLGVLLPLNCQEWHTFYCCEICHCQQCMYQQWHGNNLAMTRWHCQKDISVVKKLLHWSLLATMWQCGCLIAVQLPYSCWHWSWLATEWQWGCIIAIQLLTLVIADNYVAMWMHHCHSVAMELLTLVIAGNYVAMWKHHCHSVAMKELALVIAGNYVAMT